MSQNPRDKKHIVIGGKPINKLNVVDKTKEPKTPAFYTEYEGGEWIPWRAGKIKPYELDITEARAIAKDGKWQGYYLLVNGILFHSLLFPTINPYKFIRWDALNGWTGFVDVK